MASDTDPDPTLPAPVSGTEPTLAPAQHPTVPETIGATDATVGAPIGGEMNLPDLEPSSYELREQLGAGGMGKVVVARDRRLGRLLAVKVAQTRDPSMRVRFTREAVLTARLQHPSIIPVHEAGLWSGEPFYAMKLVAGKSLAQLIARTTTLDERLALLPNVIAVVDALAYAHAQRVIHRDLKPDNVIVGEYGETIVIDWGLAKELDTDDPEPYRGVISGDAQQTVEGAAMGTPSYMAPEQAAGERVDERADVYGLGAMLYHVLCGRAPYAGKTADEVIRQVLEGAPPPLASRQPGIRADLLAIVDKAMARAPADRYANAKQLADDLRRFERGQLVAAHAYSRAELVRRFVVRHKAALAIAVVALAGIAIALALYIRAEVRDRSARAARIAELLRADDTDEGTTRAALAIGNFAVAAETLQRQVEHLREHAGETQLARRFAARDTERAHVARVAEFYRHARAATFLTGDEDQGDAAIVELHAALNQLGALAGDAFATTRWYDDLAPTELTPAQRRDFQEEAYRQVMLLGLMEFKAGALLVPPKIFVAKNAKAAAHFHAALAALAQVSTLERALAIKPAHIARIWQTMTLYFLAKVGDDADAKLAGPLAAEAADAGGAENAIDHAFLGAGEFLVWQGKDTPLGIGMRLFFPELFDYEHPLETAEKELRLAIALEPGQYWPNFMLGWTLRSKNQPGAAELAFDNCIAIQPDNFMSYSQRAQSLAEGGERARAEQDSQYTLVHAPDHPVAWWSRGDLLRYLGDRAGAIEAYLHALDLEDHLQTKFSRQVSLAQIGEWVRHAPGSTELLAYPDAPTQTLLAAFALAVGDTARATSLAKQALVSDGRNARAHAILGAATGDLAQLDAALAIDPKSFAAALAKARLAKTDAAIALATKLARTDGQRLEASRARD